MLGLAVLPDRAREEISCHAKPAYTLAPARGSPCKSGQRQTSKRSGGLLLVPTRRGHACTGTYLSAAGKGTLVSLGGAPPWRR